MSSWPSVIVDVDLKKTKILLLSRVSKVHHVPTLDAGPQDIGIIWGPEKMRRNRLTPGIYIPFLYLCCTFYGP